MSRTQIRLAIAERDLEEMLREMEPFYWLAECPDASWDERRAAGAQLRYYGQLVSRKRRAIAKLKGQVQEVQTGV